MASPCSSSNIRTMQVSITVVFFFSLTVLLPTKSVCHEAGGSSLFHIEEKDNTNKGWRNIEVEESRRVIGSKPPSCMHKCMRCRPCLATLVAPDHQKRKSYINSNKGLLFKVWSRGEDDDPYYLLSWKCTCGNKLFQP